MPACETGDALATTTRMSMKFREGGTEMRILVAMRELLKATEQRVGLIHDPEVQPQSRAGRMLAWKTGHALATTTRMSMKFREGGTRMRILVSDARVAESNGAARWTYTLPRRSSFGAKANGPLADQGAFAPETTTRMSLKFHKGGTRMSRRQKQ